MRCTLALPLLLSLSACAAPTQTPPPPGDQSLRADPTRYAARTLVYECRDGEFIARTGPGEMAVWVEDRYAVLSQVRSASGTKYQEGDILFWSKGEEAILDVGARSYRECRLNPARVPWEDARRRGIDFRAAGNEPGWHVEVREGDRLLFIGDYGATRKMFDQPVSAHGAQRSTWSASLDGDLIEITAEWVECQDTMSGARYPMSVELRLNETHYRGCGMQLEHPWE